jgi:CheY-like chemotaxis protein/DNA-directed RNA polymerase specialized sigma24 family protein
MTISQSIAPHLPSLRRFARALSGSQEMGDGAVVALLETLVEGPTIFQMDFEPKVELYRLFVNLWNDADTNALPSFDTDNAEVLRRVRTQTSKDRQAYLLLGVEEFEPEDIAEIFNVDVAEVVRLIVAADYEMVESMDRREILIIEDEPFEASHLQDIMSSCGHRVTGVGRTHSEAVALARMHKPQLILSSRILADGSSGVAAANEILESIDVPVIFITGYCGALLTGQRPEPAFVLGKPYRAEAVKAMVAQALLFERRSPLKA